MKKIIVIIILILCVGCNKEEERIINVLNWSSYIPNDVVEDFENITGIKVNYSTYSSNEELLAKVSSAKEGTYDLIFPSDYMVEIMISRNLIDKINLNKLSNIDNINTNYLSLEYDPKNEYSIPFIAATTVIAVNKDKIYDNIDSYNDLLNPKYKNEIVLIDDQRIIIGMGLLASGYDMNSVEEQEIEKAKEWLINLKPNLKAYDSDSPKNFLITEEASIAVLWNAEAALAKQQNPNIEIVFPKEGIALSIDNFVIPKNSKHKEDTYLFIDYILRPDVMKRIIESYPYKNINIETDKLLSDEYLLNDAANIKDEYIETGYFVKNIGDKVKLYDKTWVYIK